MTTYWRLKVAYILISNFENMKSKLIMKICGQNACN